MGQPAGFKVIVRVRGELAASWSPVLAGLAVTPAADGSTRIEGRLPDEAAVHGLLAAIRDLGLPLLVIQATPDPSEPAHVGGS